MTQKTDSRVRIRLCLLGFAKALVLISLLAGPTLLVGRWAQQEPGLIPYFQAGYRYRLEAKKIMFQQIGCPTSVVIGTSMSEVALNAESLKEYRKKTGDESFEPIFAFASPGTRPMGMLGVWRWIQDQGCTPKYLFIEANPVILNVARGGDFERAFMDIRMQLEVSEDRFSFDAYTLRFRADLATWWRSYIYRNREPILKYLKARFTSDKKLTSIKSIPADGKLKPTSTRELVGKFADSQYRHTLGTFKRREFKYEFSSAYVGVILRLAKEASRDGSQAIIQTPPVPPMFHEFMDVANATQRYCDFYNEAIAMPDIRWYSEYGNTQLPATEFSDWLHVNHKGAQAYVFRLLSAVSSDEFSPDEYCTKR